MTYPRWIWGIGVSWRFFWGYISYLFKGSTSHEAYINMRRMFRATNGRFNDGWGAAARFLRPPYRLRHARGFLGDLTPEDLSRITNNLQTKGVYVFQSRLDLATCRRLVDFAERTPAVLSPKPASGETLAVYDRENPITTKYLFETEALKENKDIQRLMSDHSLLAVAQSYLRCKPFFTSVYMWWSTSLSDKPCDEAAQLYHFDMAHPKFIKIFIYLTDVTEKNGPHKYVIGSHHRNPPQLLRQDRRFSDQEVEACYPPENFLAMVGPQGTMFVEDTRGLHKGVPLVEGERLVLQFQFSVSRFGANYPKLSRNGLLPDLLEMIERYPYTYSNFEKPA